MPFVWSIGTIIGPAVGMFTVPALLWERLVENDTHLSLAGGYFSDPSENFPSAFPPDGLFATFPFLLPNLICASLLLIAIMAGFVAIEETHPDMQPWSTQADLDNTAAETPLLATAGATADAPANIAAESYGTFNQVQTEQMEKWRVNQDGRPSSTSSISDKKAFTKKVVMLTVALGIFTYHSMTYDTLLPIFLGDERGGDIQFKAVSASFAGGLGMTLQQVGMVMAFNGIIALFIQGVVFPVMASWLGIWKIFILVTLGHPISYFIVPYLVLLPQSLVYLGIYLCLAVRNFFSILAYPVLLILLKEASPSPNCLGKINGLAASIGAASRTIASPIGGFLYSIGLQVHFTPLSWWASSLVALIGAGQIFFMRRQKNRVTVHGLTRHMSRESLSGQFGRHIVRVKVDETIYEDSEHSDEETGLLERN